MLESVTPPLPLRMLNRAGAVLRSLGLPIVPLTPAALEARAVGQAGLSDFGEPDFEEPLAILCRSAEEDARLSFLGRMAVRDQITRALVTRLRRIDLRKRRPEIFTAPLTPPLIVLGLPRSGTTLLHRLLSLAPDARAIPMWQLQQPIPGPGPDRRREEAVAQVARIKKLAPEIDAKHHIDADEPEECVFLLDSSLMSASFWMFAPVYGYIAWFLDQDQRAAYRVYREHLQILQAETPGRRLTLKAPAHTPHLEALFAAIPEVMIVQTHRDPVDVVNSVNSLFHSVHGVVTEHVDTHRMGAVNLDLMADLVERGLAARDKVPADRILDVRYGDLTRDPMGSVRRIHEHFGLPFEDAFAARLRHWLEHRPQDKFGRHVYAAEDFGMTDAQIAERFKGYVARFGVSS